MEAGRLLFVAFILACFFIPVFLGIRKLRRKQGRLNRWPVGMMIWPFGIALGFAFLFAATPSTTSFIAYGLLAVVLDYIVLFIYWKKRKEEMRLLAPGRLTPVIAALSLVIPFFSTYAAFCFLFWTVLRD